MFWHSKDRASWHIVLCIVTYCTAHRNILYCASWHIVLCIVTYCTVYRDILYCASWHIVLCIVAYCTVHRDILCRASWYIIIKKPTKCTISQLYLGKELYMFRTDLLSIIRSLITVYTAIRFFHTSYVDCLMQSEYKYFRRYSLHLGQLYRVHCCPVTPYVVHARGRVALTSENTLARHESGIQRVPVSTGRMYAGHTGLWQFADGKPISGWIIPSLECGYAFGWQKSIDVSVERNCPINTTKNYI
jgi:hypothetical protein